MAKTAHPHPASMLWWACAVEVYAADMADAFPPNSADLAGSSKPSLSDPDTQAGFRDAARRAKDDHEFWRLILTQEAREAGAPDDWLIGTDGQGFVSTMADHFASTLSAGQFFHHQTLKPAKARSIDNPPRSIVVDVIAGAFFLAGGDMAEAARLLNRGVPTCARVEGYTPSEVRNAIDSFREARMRGAISPLACRALSILAAELAARFQAKIDLLAQLKATPDFRTASAQSIFWTLVNTGQLLDLHHDAVERARSPAIQANASRGLLSIAEANVRALDRIRKRRAAAA